MKKQTLRNWLTLTLVLTDAVMITVGFLLSYALRYSIPFPSPLKPDALLSSFSGLISISVGIVLFTLFFNRQYYIPRAVSRVDQFYSVIFSVTIGLLIAVALTVFVYSTDFEIPRAMVFYAWMLSIILIMIGRTLFSFLRVKLQQRGIGKDRVLIVGSGEMARVVLQRILWSPQLGYEVVGVVAAGEEEDDIQDEEGMIAGVKVLGQVYELPDLIESKDIDEVIIAIPEKGHREAVKIISMCERGEVSIKVFPDIFQMVATQPTIDDLGGLPLLSVRDYAMRGYLLLFKRLFDFAFSFTILVLFSPLILLVALAIRVESPGSVFFVQERMGLDGKPFKILKFRSMRNDAERGGPGWTVADDPRQTRLGRWLRRLDIDEWPQLINVLLGEMSLVGPRPEQPYYVDRFRNSVPRYMDRHRARAGMTGWAQVNGLRGDTSVAERTKFDLWYVENWSLLLDVKIVVRTIWQNLFGNDSQLFRD
ncbi:MAG: exopolysaccharide biosynthesis polyprenyl glycosylphosphotransferase [Cellvibrionaceae bacterium]|jgi:exopolysaccharide biosynthesis polyprenyl glycosylphosphotransferase